MVGTNGILIPPDGYMQGVREICDRHGILLIVDEVMAGFGRTGRWFAIDHWGVVPDIITMAKGLTGGYVQLGAVGMRREIAEAFRDKVFFGGLTYNSHPLACAAGLAAIQIYEDDNLIERADRDGPPHARAAPRARGEAPLGRASRSIGLFGMVELVRNARPVHADGAVQRHLRRDGRVRPGDLARVACTRSCAGTAFMTNPPLTISEEELREGFDDHRPRARGDRRRGCVRPSAVPVIYRHERW